MLPDGDRTMDKLYLETAVGAADRALGRLDGLACPQPRRRACPELGRRGTKTVGGAGGSAANRPASVRKQVATKATFAIEGATPPRSAFASETQGALRRDSSAAIRG